MRSGRRTRLEAGFGSYAKTRTGGVLAHPRVPAENPAGEDKVNR